MKEKFVTIRHPELDAESVVLAESVSAWVEQGWEEVGPTYPHALEESEDLVDGDAEPSVFDFNQEDEPSVASEKE